MPREIDWFEVGTLGSTPLYTTKLHARSRNMGRLITLEELQEAIKQEREECALVCEDQVEDENDMISLNYKCAKTIRARGNK